MPGEEYIKKLLSPCVRETSNEVAERVSLNVNLLSLNITRYTLIVKPLSLPVISKRFLYAFHSVPHSLRWVSCDIDYLRISHTNLKQIAYT